MTNTEHHAPRAPVGERRPRRARRVALAIGATAALAVGTITAVSAHADASPGGHFTGTLADGATWIADVPADWNGTLLLYSHGFGPLVARNAPDPDTAAALLAEGYALAGSSYDPFGSQWALLSAVRDQFETIEAVKTTALPDEPDRVIAVGSSMGGLVTALMAEQGAGRIDGALSTCGIVAGAVNLNQYQLNGEWALARLLPGVRDVQLVDFDPANPFAPFATAAALTAAAAQAQATPQGQARLALAMALLNVAPWDATLAEPASAHDPVAYESAQYRVLFGGPFNTLTFLNLARPSIEAAAGGNSSGTVGVDFAAVLNSSPAKNVVKQLYKDAGLDLAVDLAALTADADITADPSAVASLQASSVPTGHLDVPMLTVHTVSDQLVPVEMEDSYAQQVRRSGDSSLLRQAYVSAVGHCNFSPAELVASVHAIEHRVASGHWANVATAKSLQDAATGLDLGAARFVDYKPGNLTGAVVVP
jgi:pimeloyl-ACP methyl ester carboxylesterase